MRGDAGKISPSQSGSGLESDARAVSLTARQSLQILPSAEKDLFARSLESLNAASGTDSSLLSMVERPNFLPGALL